jgi:predicted membrane chloride channel (bestrophin family)
MQEYKPISDVTISSPNIIPKLIMSLGWVICLILGLIAATFIPLNIVAYVLKG